MSRRENAVISENEIQRQKNIISEIKSKLDLNNKKRYAFVETYGCAQNTDDSQKLVGMLSEMGYERTYDKEIADVILYNTCAVRENAELRVFGNIGALKAMKAKRPDLIIGVCGCMMQQEHIVEAIKKKYKHVDIVFGTHTLYRFPEIMAKAIEKTERVFDVIDVDGAIAEDLPVIRENTTNAMVSVMYGCNNFCTYCIVPYVRGRERSRDKEDILREVKTLADEGYKEITLLGQNVNSYGNDLDEDIDFADLLTMVEKVEGIERIRFVTSHPKDISDKLIDVLANSEKICKQLHLPIQAGSNKILKAMNRKYTREEYLKKIDKIKSKIPDIALTSDIIVGFPGETNEDFEETIKVLEKVRYDSVFSFVYSRRKGTPAAKMEDVITLEEKKKNLARLMDVQADISREKNLALEGKTVKILVEGPSKTDKTFLTGRTDGGKIVNFPGDEKLTGKIINVKITKANAWSMYGEVEGE